MCFGGTTSERSFKDQGSEVTLERAELVEGPRRESLHGPPRAQLLEVSLGMSGSEARGGGGLLAVCVGFSEFPNPTIKT